MYLTLDISTREQLIALGTILGEAIQSSNRERSWMIALEGDARSGKSLIPLAVDQVFNPHAYPQGITRDLSVDWLLKPGCQPSGTVVFDNFGTIPYRDYDNALDEFESKNLHAKVLVASNVARCLTTDFNRSAGFRHSKRVDLALEFDMLPGGFQRRLTAMPNDPLLEKILAELTL